MEGNQEAQQEIYGHNTEITVRGRIYHVQTENIGGPDEPSITTLVYNEGRLVKKLVTPYGELISKPGFPRTLEKRVRRQHLQVLAQLKGGKLGASARPEGRR
jgi:hypothetical protein